MERYFVKPENPQQATGFNFADELRQKLPKYRDDSLNGLAQLIEVYGGGEHQMIAIDHAKGSSIEDLARAYGIPKFEVIERLMLALDEIVKGLTKQPQMQLQQTTDEDPITYQLSDVDDLEWRDKAACLKADPELFFPVGTVKIAELQIDKAKAVCGRCAVREVCLKYALDTNQDDGVWGGLSEDERRKLKRKQYRARRY